MDDNDCVLLLVRSLALRWSLGGRGLGPKPGPKGRGRGSGAGRAPPSWTLGPVVTGIKTLRLSVQLGHWRCPAPCGSKGRRAFRRRWREARQCWAENKTVDVDDPTAKWRWRRWRAPGLRWIQNRQSGFRSGLLRTRLQPRRHALTDSWSGTRRNWLCNLHLRRQW